MQVVHRNEQETQVAASGVFTSREKFTTFLSCYIIFYFFKCQYDIKITHPKNSDRNLFPYAMTYFNFFTNNSCFLILFLLQFMLYL